MTVTLKARISFVFLIPSDYSVEKETDKNPRLNINITISFLRNESDNFASGRNGRPKVAISRARFSAAVAHPCAFTAEQWPWKLASQRVQAPYTGLH